MSEIRENLQIVHENIEMAARKSGRKPEEITLIAVTKTIETERIRELMSLGVTDLGENKVQEMLSKYDQLQPTPAWHMIGHLQTNKVKQIIDKTSLIQSVDSLHLAQEIDRRAGQRGMRMDILVEINIGNEDTKYGIKSDQTERFIERLYILTNVRVRGLMCVAPFVEDIEKNRFLYEKMYTLLVDMRKRFTHNMELKYLSMGMTNDYKIAIEEGANMVRIGTALFGNRNIPLKS